MDEDFAELFIYNYENLNRESFIKQFIKACGKESIATDECNKIAEHIFVIDFGGDKRESAVFLQLLEVSSEY